MLFNSKSSVLMQMWDSSSIRFHVLNKLTISRLYVIQESVKEIKQSDIKVYDDDDVFPMLNFETKNIFHFQLCSSTSCTTAWSSINAIHYTNAHIYYK